MTEPLLDHVVLASPNLDQLVTDFHDRTGIQPAFGGRHVGGGRSAGGTRNYLVRLGETSYLELIGPDVLDGTRPLPATFGINTLTGPRIATWMVHPVDIERTVATADSRGFDAGRIGPLSRQAPTGQLLSWRLTLDTPDKWGGLAPGLIDWSDTPHPASSGLPEAPLVALRGYHPDPAGVRRVLDALGVSLDVEQADQPELRLTIDTPKGQVTLW